MQYLQDWPTPSQGSNQNKKLIILNIPLETLNNYRIVDFLKLIYGQITGQSDMDKYTDLWWNCLLINRVAFQKYTLLFLVVLKQPKLIVAEPTKCGCEKMYHDTLSAHQK